MYQVAFSIVKKIAGKYWYFIAIFALLAFVSALKYQNGKLNAELKQIGSELTLKDFEAKKANESLVDTLKRREVENDIILELEKEKEALEKQAKQVKEIYNENNSIVDNFRSVVDRLFAETTSDDSTN